MKSELAAVILNYNDAKTTLKLLNGIKQFDIIKHIVVVDNCSTDGSFCFLTEYISSKVDVIKSEKNGGYGYGNNFGIKYLNEKYHPTHILIANPDIEIKENVLTKMLEIFETSKSVAVVSPFMLNRDGKRTSITAWRVPTKYEYIFSAELLCGHFLKPCYYKGLDKITDKDFVEVECVAGSLLMVDATLMQHYGLYDENIFLYCEETILGYKLKKAGYKTILLLNETYLHMHGVSISKTIGSKLKVRKMMLESEKYVLKKYLNANPFDMLFAKLVHGISMIEYRILLMIKNG